MLKGAIPSSSILKGDQVNIEDKWNVELQGNSQKAKDAAKSHLQLIGSDLEDFIASVSSTLKN